MKTYAVTMIPKHPAWDERDGITIHVRAKGRAEAISYGRRQFYADGHQTGGATFRAAIITEAR